MILVSLSRYSLVSAGPAAFSSLLWDAMPSFVVDDGNSSAEDGLLYSKFEVLSPLLAFQLDSLLLLTHDKVESCFSTSASTRRNIVTDWCVLILESHRGWV